MVAQVFWYLPLTWKNWMEFLSQPHSALAVEGIWGVKSVSKRSKSMSPLEYLALSLSFTPQTSLLLVSMWKAAGYNSSGWAPATLCESWFSQPIVGVWGHAPVDKSLSASFSDS